MGQEINVLALVKGEEKFIFLFDDARRTDTLRMLGKFAADPELSFTWYDAAVLGQKIRETTPLPSDLENGKASQPVVDPKRRFDIATTRSPRRDA